MMRNSPLSSFCALNIGTADYVCISIACYCMLSHERVVGTPPLVYSNNWSGLFFDNNFLHTARLLVQITFKPFECGGHKAKITYHRKQEIVFSLGQGANEILASTQRKIQLQI